MNRDISINYVCMSTVLAVFISTTRVTRVKQYYNSLESLVRTYSDNVLRAEFDYDYLPYLFFITRIIMV